MGNHGIPGLKKVGFSLGNLGIPGLKDESKRAFRWVIMVFLVLKMKLSEHFGISVGSLKALHTVCQMMSHNSPDDVTQLA